MCSTDAGANIKTLRADFQLAVVAWRDGGLTNWQALWLGPECAMLKYARAVQCDFNDEDLATLTKLEECDHSSSAEYLLKELGYPQDERPQAVKQFALLMKGLLHGVLAGYHLRTWKPGQDLSGQFVVHAQHCIDAYQQAWLFQGNVVEAAAGTNLFSADRVAQALRDLVGNQQLPPLPIFNWLVIRRLWGYLLDEEAAEKEFATEASVLLVNQLSENQVEGVVGPLMIRRAVEGQLGYYLDPVAMGQSLVDDSMIESLQLAWRVCLPGLREYLAKQELTDVALRLGPQLPGVSQISGRSAGGLLACGLFAAAQGKSLNTDASASFTLKAPASDTAELDPSQIKIGGVSAKTLPDKLKAASVRTPRLQNVILEKEQAEEFRQTGEALGVSVHGVANLAEAFHLLTGDAQLEQILRQYSDAVWDDWQELRQGRPPTGNDEDHKLDFFIEPHLGLLAEGESIDTSQSERQTNEELQTGRYERVAGDGAEALVGLLQEQMLDADRWLCMTEDAGAGKTVFTLWLRAFLSSPHWRDARHDFRPWLAVRCEGGWPRDLQQTLMQHLRARCPDVKPKQASDAVDYALRNRRVVLILDSLDQAGDEDIAAFNGLLSDEVISRQIRIFLTSRAHAAREREATLLKAARWKKGRVELFDDVQQDTYLSQLDSAAVNELLPDRDLVRELTKFPVVLRLIRQLIEERDPQQPLEPFRFRGDLYWRTSHQLLERAFKKSGRTIESEDIDILQDALSCLAFEMTARGMHNYTVPAGEIRSVKQAARQRSTADKDEWQSAMTILKDTHLTDRCILEGNDKQHLSFRSRKMMEFFAGLHLARYAQEKSQNDVTEFTNDGEWEWTWRFAIETPLMTSQTGDRAFREDILCDSLASLFAPPQRGLRPSELMYRAWHMMQQTEFPFREQIIAEYRQQFLDILAGDDLQRARLAAEVLHLDDLIVHVNEGRTGQWRLNNLRPKHPSYVRCCNQQDKQHLTFWMGTTDAVIDGYNRERPRHRVRIPAFDMAACPVTRVQYRLFDPQLEEASESGFDNKAPEDDCPMIYTNWFDSFCFALWIGDRYRLPSETEWEGAARGGKDGPHDVIGIPPYDDTFSANQVNFDGNFPLCGERSQWMRRTLPVRWDESRRHEAQEQNSQVAEVLEYRPNAWCIWQAHGNVWEWCLSEYEEDLYANRAKRILEGLHQPPTSLSELTVEDWQRVEVVGLLDVSPEGVLSAAVVVPRVLRGGSWSDDADDCRSAHRNRSEPGLRADGVVGFRIVRDCR